MTTAGHWAIPVALRNVEACRGRFSALADPWKVITIEPNAVLDVCLMHMTTRRETGSKSHDWGRVVPGDWDLGNPPFDRTPIYCAVYDRYVRGMSWEETGAIERQARFIDSGGRAGGCTTRAQLVERFRRLDDVFQDMEKGGFRFPRKGEEGEFHYPFVSIGRDGSLLHAKSGRHRLAMAIVLGIPAVPAYVLSRHHDWQCKRERWLASGTAQRATHPDLEEFGLDQAAIRS